MLINCTLGSIAQRNAKNDHLSVQMSKVVAAPCRCEEWRHVGQLKLPSTVPSIGGPCRPCSWRHAGVAGCHHRLGRHASAAATNLPALIPTSFFKDFFAFLLIALIEGTSRLFFPPNSSPRICHVLYKNWHRYYLVHKCSYLSQHECALLVLGF
jgi:hypothetical protein